MASTSTVVSTSAAPASAVHVCVVSFGFRYRQPPRTDMALCHVVDLRALPRPWAGVDADAIRGTDREFAERLFADSTVSAFWPDVVAQAKAFLAFVRECCAASNGKQLSHPPVIAFGCRSGRHRSVAFAERLAAVAAHWGQTHAEEPLRQTRITVEHRDTARKPSPGSSTLSRASAVGDGGDNLAATAAGGSRFAIECNNCGVRTSSVAAWNQHIRSKSHWHKGLGLQKKKKKQRAKRREVHPTSRGEHEPGAGTTTHDRQYSGAATNAQAPSRKKGRGAASACSVAPAPTVVSGT